MNPKWHQIQPFTIQFEPGTLYGAMCAKSADACPETKDRSRAVDT